MKIRFSQAYLYLNFFLKAFQFSVNLHYFLIVIWRQYSPRDRFPLQSLELSLAAFLTNDINQQVFNRWGHHFDGFCNSPCIAWHSLGFSSAMRGGDAKGLLQLHLYLSNLDHILFHRIRSSISKHLLRGKTFRREQNRAIS